MDKAEFFKKKKDLKEEYKQKEIDLCKEYAYSHAKAKVGDVVETDCGETLKIITTSLLYSSTHDVEVQYSGIRLKKGLSPTKDKTPGWTYDSRIVKVLK